MKFLHGAIGFGLFVKSILDVTVDKKVEELAYHQQGPSANRASGFHAGIIDRNNLRQRELISYASE